MIQLKNTETTYGQITIYLHWIMAAIIIGMVIVGLTMVRIPVSLQKLKLFGWHKEFGILILALACVRAGWWFANRVPVLPASIPRWQAFAAHAVHFLLYCFMFALPITGWLMTSAAGLPVSVFGLFTLPNLISADENLRNLFVEIHTYLAYALIAVICAHVGAALKHFFINKDDVMQRMLP